MMMPGVLSAGSTRMCSAARWHRTLELRRSWRGCAVCRSTRALRGYAHRAQRQVAGAGAGPHAGTCSWPPRQPRSPPPCGATAGSPTSSRSGWARRATCRGCGARRSAPMGGSWPTRTSARARTWWPCRLTWSCPQDTPRPTEASTLGWTAPPCWAGPSTRTRSSSRCGSSCRCGSATSATGRTRSGAPTSPRSPPSSISRPLEEGPARTAQPPPGRQHEPGPGKAH